MYESKLMTKDLKQRVVYTKKNIRTWKMRKIWRRSGKLFLQNKVVYLSEDKKVLIYNHSKLAKASVFQNHSKAERKQNVTN